VKFSLSWLRTHLQTDVPLDTILTTLSAIGLEVDGVEDPAAKLAPFVTARVIEAVQHPNADRLRVCRVDAGGEEIQVVCGAPNARTGMGAVFAPPGAVVPGSGITLKIGEIRGVKSAGMLVSARELGLGEDHDGIIELPADTRPGQSYAALIGLDDPVIEIGVTPNRGDALSVRGVARDLAAAGLGTLKPWGAAKIEGSVSRIGWRNEWPEAAPWLLGRTITGVTNGPSPAWLQARLKSVGLRPINALVDITNFFTFDIGRPLHVFDADRVAGGELVLRPGQAGETLAALNGKTLALGEGDAVIADADGPVSLAGVMGGEGTGVTEATTSVFVECALFDPVRVALTGGRLQLTSDARQRFERGVDSSLLPQALDAATRMILDLCGGTPSVAVSAGAEPAWQRNATLRFRRLAELGGMDVAPDDAVAILERLGFGVQARDAESVTVAVPPWRNDIAPVSRLDTAGLDPARAAVTAAGAAAMEPECDLIEEVLRIKGLDGIVPVSLPMAQAVPAPALSQAQTQLTRARRMLAARGLAECVTFSFVPRADAALFDGGEAALQVANPISADLDQMRPTPLANLARAAAENTARGYGDVGLFEIGPGYTAAGQASVAAGLRCGSIPRHWQGGARRFDAMDAKADVFALLAGLGVAMDALSVTADAPGHYHPGQSGVVRQGPKKILAQFGALHPHVLRAFDLENAAGFEIFLDEAGVPKRRRRAAPVLAPLQPVRRDFAFLVSAVTPAETLLRAVRSADRTLIVRAGVFDQFAGATLREGQRSLGIEIVIQPRERSLTDPEIENLCGRVVEAVTKATGATLR
jgi:phenylalanyl-tRNA synthetase beta chain